MDMMRPTSTFAAGALGGRVRGVRATALLAGIARQRLSSALPYCSCSDRSAAVLLSAHVRILLHMRRFIRDTVIVRLFLRLAWGAAAQQQAAAALIIEAATHAGLRLQCVQMTCNCNAHARERSNESIRLKNVQRKGKLLACEIYAILWVSHQLVHGQ